MAAAAALRPVLEDFIDRPRRQKLSPMALVTILGAAFATRGIPAALGLAGRIGTRRSRRVARGAIQPALKLGDALILTRYTPLQATDLLIHAKENHDHDLTALVIDRLSLSTVHASKFDTTELCPPNRLNGYGF